MKPINLKEIIPIKIRNSFVQEKTEEELRKIVTLDDIQDYFDGVVRIMMPNFIQERYTEHIERVFIKAINDAYSELVIHRETADRQAMQDIFEDELSITMHANGALVIGYARIIIDDETNTFTVISKKEQRK